MRLLVLYRRAVDPVSSTEEITGEHVKVASKEKPKVKEESVAKDEVKLKVKISVMNVYICAF